MIICPTCQEKHPVGAVLCRSCRMPLPVTSPSGSVHATPASDPPSDAAERWDDRAAEERATTKLVIIGLNGALIPEAADLAVPIPMGLLRELRPVRIGRRSRPKFGEPPEMDFGPFLQTRRKPPYPLSREAAILYLEDGRLLLRRTGSAAIYKKDGDTNCLVAQGDVVPLHDGDVLSFGHPDDYVRVIVRIPI